MHNSYLSTIFTVLVHGTLYMYGTLHIYIQYTAHGINVKSKNEGEKDAGELCYYGNYGNIHVERGKKRHSESPRSRESERERRTDREGQYTQSYILYIHYCIDIHIHVYIYLHYIRSK